MPRQIGNHDSQALLKAALLAYENPDMVSAYGPATFEDQAFRIGRMLRSNRLPRPAVVRCSYAWTFWVTLGHRTAGERKVRVPWNRDGAPNFEE